MFRRRGIPALPNAGLLRRVDLAARFAVLAPTGLEYTSPGPRESANAALGTRRPVPLRAESGAGPSWHAQTRAGIPSAHFRAQTLMSRPTPGGARGLSCPGLIYPYPLRGADQQQKETAGKNNFQLGRPAHPALLRIHPEVFEAFLNFRRPPRAVFSRPKLLLGLFVIHDAAGFGIAMDRAAGAVSDVP